MIVNGKHYRTLWFSNGTVYMIDQNMLPFSFEIKACKTWKETSEAIRNMNVRGAGAIGVAAGFAMAQAFIQASGSKENNYLINAKITIESTRPTARDLFCAIQKVFSCTSAEAAISEALKIAETNCEECRLIGEHGKILIRSEMGILTHCNAGWLAFVDNGSALAPIYEAKRRGKNFTVFVDETRPRNQGARLTAWELGNENITHYILADNAAAYLMQQGKIHLVITGADRIAANGDTANKIGTLEKAILANTFGIPFYVAAPLSTFDRQKETGKEIPIEFRNPDEILFMSGMSKDGQIHEIRVAAPGSMAINPAFDITPAEYITGIITSKGIISAKQNNIAELFDN